MYFIARGEGLEPETPQFIPSKACVVPLKTFQVLDISLMSVVNYSTVTVSDHHCTTKMGK